MAYFFPLMEETERRLGFRPKYGAFDAAYDAFYVYEHFHRENQPIETGLAMPLKYTYTCKTTRIEHERGRYYCPLVYPERTDKECPIGHKNWPKGCITTIATSVGARIRHQLDRESALYKEVYKQRTATERVNSQAKALGIKRPKLRSRQVITNQNTLIYVLINLRALHRLRQRKEEKARA